MAAPQCAAKNVSLPTEKRVVDPIAGKCECKALPEYAKLEEFILIGIGRFREMVEMLNYCVENGLVEEEKNVNNTD